jgi:hypothetical protein
MNAGKPHSPAPGTVIRNGVCSASNADVRSSGTIPTPGPYRKLLRKVMGGSFLDKSPSQGGIECGISMNGYEIFLQVNPCIRINEIACGFPTPGNREHPGIA